MMTPADEGLDNDLFVSHSRFDTDPPLLHEQKAGSAMRCPECAGDTRRDWETGEYLADDCGTCGGDGWLPDAEPDFAYQMVAADYEEWTR